jgi:transposase
MRSHTIVFKTILLARLENGERLAAVAAELGLKRDLVYRWRRAYRALGEAGLNRKRGPKVKLHGLTPPVDPPDRPLMLEAELVAARRRIVELEAKIGRQQMDLDFFRRALQPAPVTSLPVATPPASTRSSKR